MHADDGLADVDRRRRRDDRTKKRHERDAELAFWFHIDPRGLTPVEKIGYLANLERCKAQQRIHLGQYNPTDWKGVYDLWLYAFGDEELARKARTQALELYVDQQCGRARR